MLLIPMLGWSLGATVHEYATGYGHRCTLLRMLAVKNVNSVAVERLLPYLSYLVLGGEGFANL